MEILKSIQNYWDSRSNGFSSSTLDELTTDSAEKWKANFKQYLPNESMKILDCGAGAGFFTVILSTLGHDVTAIDYSQEMLDKTQKNLDKYNLSAKLMQMDAQSLDFPDCSFDVIVSRNLIWNLEQPEKAYREFRRVLKPGGLLFLEDGNHYLYLYDKVQAENRKNRMKSLAESYNHGKHNVDKIDFSIMEEIAKELPLSSIKRPEWDLEQLKANSFSEIETKFTFAHNDPKNPLPSQFVIRAQKN